MIKKLHLKSWLLLLCMIVGAGTAWADDYNVTYSYDVLKDMLQGSFEDASSYWKVPATAGNTATIAIPITNQPTSDITITLNIATFGSGDNPSSSNTTITAVGTETESNWSGSGVSSYPTSSTFVKGVLTISKPSNPTTLSGLTITMGVNTGVKIFRLKSVTVSYTSGGSTPVVTIPAPTLSPAAGTVESGTKVTISNFNSNYLYYYTTDNTDPAVDDEGTVENGTAFPTDGLTITSTTTLKVIATDGEGHVSDITSATYTVEQTANYEWVETNLADLTSSDIFVIVGNNGNNYAMSNDKGTSEAPTAVSVTIENGKITSTVSNNIKWSASGNATDGYIFYPNGNTEKWLYCNTTASSGSNNNIRVGVSSRKRFNLNDKDYLVTKDDKTTRYLSIYDNSEWRGYTNTSNGAVALKFYKRVSENEPTLTAFDVEVAYDAASGSISYALENATGGTLSATTTANWLTIGHIDTTVPFTCTTNPTASERIASVTLSYSLPSGQTLTATATVTQAANPDVTITIAEARAQGTGDVQTKGVVTSVYGKTAYIQDANAAIAVRGNDDLAVAVGYEIKVSGTLGVYSGLLQIQVPTITVLSQNKSVTPEAMTVGQVIASTNQGWLVKIEEATVTTIDGQNVTIAEGENTVVVRFNTTPSGFAINDKLTLTGNISCYGETKQIANPTVISVIESAEPLITVDPTSINATYDGEEGNISVTYDNVDTDAIEIVFYTTAEATTTTTYSWIDAIFDEMNNVQYTIDANEGEARTAYMKVHGLDAEGNDVYSDLITITQAAGTGDQYALFNGDLVEGDYIIYYNGKAMNTTITNNRLQYAEVTPANNVISTDNTAIVWHIAKSGDYWTIYNADADAYAAATSSNNQAQMLADGTDDKALWTVSDEYDFTNKANSRLLRNNGTYGFACYGANTGGALSLYKKVEAITLSDVNSDDLPESANPANVTLTRKFVNKWNPICVPFDVTDLSVFGEGYEVVKYTGDADNNGNISLKFETVTDKMDANVPYMVWVNEDADVSEPWVLTFNGVNYNPSNNPVSAGTNYNYVGVYKNYAKGTSPIVTGDVILSGGAYKTVTGNGGNAIKGFRGYWKKSATAGEAKSITAIINGQETDDIKYIELVETLTDGIYNLQGQKVNHAQKGVYIVNGKKVVIK